MQNFITKLFITQTMDGENKLTLLGNIGLILILLIIMYVISTFQKNNKKIRTKQLVIASVSIALSVILSFIKPFSLPFGGSVTFFSMFFISFIGLLYGLKTGLMAGIAYGVLQLITGPYIYHPLQILLDYPLAFACLGLSGLFHLRDRESKTSLLIRSILGYSIGVLGRYICHVISGYIFFSEYAGDTHPVLYSLSYNLTYILPELIFTIIILCLPPISKLIIELRKMAFEL